MANRFKIKFIANSKTFCGDFKTRRWFSPRKTNKKKEVFYFIAEENKLSDTTHTTASKQNSKKQKQNSKKQSW
jgi:hypothetical protein